MGILALIPGRDWLYLGIIVAVIAGFGVFVHHERQIGAQRIEARTGGRYKIIDVFGIWEYGCHCKCRFRARNTVAILGRMPRSKPAA